MLPDTKISLRQAEPRLNARLERSNITMHLSAVNAKQPIISHYLLPASHRKHSLYLMFGTIDAVVQDRIHLGSPFVSTPSARGENFIDLDSLTSSLDRRSMAYERWAYYGELDISRDRPRDAYPTTYQHIQSLHSHGNSTHKRLLRTWPSGDMSQAAAICRPWQTIALLGWRTSKRR